MASIKNNTERRHDQAARAAIDELLANIAAEEDRLMLLMQVRHNTDGDTVATQRGVLHRLYFMLDAALFVQDGEPVAAAVTTYEPMFRTAALGRA